MEHLYEVPQVRPWIRFFARTIDSILWGVLLAVCLFLITPELLTESLALALTGHFVGVVLSASCFTLLGTTPGKYLLGVEVRTFQGERLTFVDAIGREISVLFRGQGLSIPIVNLIAMGVAYGSLTSSGTASWDRDGGFVVSHRPVSTLGGTIATILLVGVLVISIWAELEG